MYAPIFPVVLHCVEELGVSDVWNLRDLGLSVKGTDCSIRSTAKLAALPNTSVSRVVVGKAVGGAGICIGVVMER